MRSDSRAPVHLFNVAVILLVVLTAFGQCLQYDFVWDDNTLIVSNEYVRSPVTWSSSFLRSFWSIGENMDDALRSFYRPVISLSYLIDFAVWGLDPRGFHLTNLLMHWLVCCVVYGLGIRLLKKPLPALVAAVLFAAHPSHVENVCWISGRTDLFCALFLFLGFGLFLLGAESERARPLQLGLSVLCFALALLSKETGLVLPLLILGYYATAGRNRMPRRRVLVVLLSLAMIAVVYLGVRHAVLGEMLGPLVTGRWMDRLASVFMVFAKYLGLLLLVVPTNPHHGEDLVGLWTVAAWVCVAVSLAYIGAVGWLCRRREMLLAFLLAWIPLALLPVFNLGTFGDVLYADRFLYIPSFGFALGFVFLALRSTPGERPGRMGLRVSIGLVYGTVIVGMVFLSRSASARWASDLTLFDHAARTSPGSAYVQVNFGNSLVREREYNRACRSYETAISLRPGYVPAHFGLGHALKELGRYEEATAVLLHALNLNERPSSASTGLAGPRDPAQGVMRILGRGRLQESSLRERENRSCVLYFDLGDAYRKQGRLSEAKEYYRKSLAILETSEPHNNLGEIFLAEGDLEGAYKHFRVAQELNPSPVTCNNLGLVLGRLTRYGEAIVCLNRGLRFPPGVLTPDIEVAIRYSLAKAYAMTGRHEMARWHAERGIVLIEKGYGPPGAAQELSSLTEEPGGVSREKPDKFHSRESASP